MTDPADRYIVARELGVQDRAKNLPLDPIENERMAFAAEKFFGDRYGLQAKVKGNLGDDRGDFQFGDVTIDVKWTPRENGRLLVALHSKPQDFYVLVVGKDPDHFRMVGYASRLEATAEIRDLGYGRGYVTDQDRLDPDVDALVDELQRGAYVQRTDKDLDLGDFMSW